MSYECIRRTELTTEYDVPDLSKRKDWEDVDSSVIENNIELVTLINQLFGRFDKKALTSHIKKELEEGKTVVLTNFYVRRKQAC